MIDLKDQLPTKTKILPKESRAVFKTINFRYMKNYLDIEKWLILSFSQTFPEINIGNVFWWEIWEYQEKISNCK